MKRASVFVVGVGRMPDSTPASRASAAMADRPLLPFPTLALTLKSWWRSGCTQRPQRLPRAWRLSSSSDEVVKVHAYYFRRPDFAYSFILPKVRSNVDRGVLKVTSPLLRIYQHHLLPVTCTLAGQVILFKTITL